jgi:hypothetical protein
VIPETEEQQEAQKSSEEDDVPFCTLLAKKKQGRQDRIGRNINWKGIHWGECCEEV